MYCTHCGAELDDSVKFCTACGMPVDDTENKTEASTQPNASATGVGAGAYNNPAVNPLNQAGTAEKKSRKPLIIAACALLACIVIAVVLIAAHSQDTEGNVVFPPSSQGGGSSSSTSSGGDATGSTSEPFNQEKAEAETRAQAEAAGMQIVTGTVHVTTYAERAHEMDGRLHDFDSNYEPFVVLLLDRPTTLKGNAVGSGPTTRQADSICVASESTGGWSAYDNQTVTVAYSPDNAYWYSDTTGILAPLDATGAIRIVPLTEQDVAATQTASSADSGDYMLADSATRAYSRSELEALDNYSLYIARNEIFARHGRKFKKADLQQYFGSKSWYNPTIEPDAFSDSMLNDIEHANAKLMLEIEQSRGSSYL